MLLLLQAQDQEEEEQREPEQVTIAAACTAGRRRQVPRGRLPIGKRRPADNDGTLRQVQPPQQEQAGKRQHCRDPSGGRGAETHGTLKKKKIVTSLFASHQTSLTAIFCPSVQSASFATLCIMCCTNLKRVINGESYAIQGQLVLLDSVKEKLSPKQPTRAQCMPKLDKT